MITQEQFKDNFIDFTLWLYDIPYIPRNYVQSIVEKVEKLFSDTYVPYIGNQVENEIKNFCKPEICGSVYTIFQENRYPFRELSNEKLRISIYKKKGFCRTRKIYCRT